MIAIPGLKDSGLNRFPFADLVANEAWLSVVGMAADLIRWFISCAAPGRSRLLHRNDCDGRCGIPQPGSFAKLARR